MTGRISREANDLLFVCFLVQSLARRTKNRVGDVVRCLGADVLRHYYDLADVYHSDNPENLFPQVIEKHALSNGAFDNVAACRYRVPTAMDIAKVFQRLILAVAEKGNADLISTLIAVYTSSCAERIENYNSSLYFESPEMVLNDYLNSPPDRCCPT